MNWNLAASFAIATLAIVNPLGKIPIWSEETVRAAEAGPSLVVHALLEKTIFQVDVVALELWLGPPTRREIRRLVGTGAAPDSLAAAVADCRDARAQLVFRRDVDLDRFLAGVTADMRRAVSAGLLDADAYAKVATGLPDWLAPLRERGIATGDRFLYSIADDTLQTVFRRLGGDVVIDQVDVGPAHRRALLASFVAPGASFGDDLIADLKRKGGP